MINPTICEPGIVMLFSGFRHGQHEGLHVGDLINAV